MDKPHKPANPEMNRRSWLWNSPSQPSSRFLITTALSKPQRLHVNRTAPPQKALVPGFGSRGARWAVMVAIAVARFAAVLGKFGDMVKEMGVDFENGSVKKVGEFVNGDELRRFGTDWVTRFVDWNRWERWKITMHSIAAPRLCG